MASRPKKTLTKRRQAELKRLYRTGEAVGRAIIQHYVEEMRTPIEDESSEAQTTLTVEEIHFLESTVEDGGINREDFTRYYNYFNIITGQEHWVNYYTQRYYRGFFKIVSILQATGSDLENLTLLENSLLKDNEEAKKLISNSRAKYNFDLQTIKDLLVRNLKLHVIFAFGNLYLYYVMLKEINDKWKLGIAELIPNMITYEKEFMQLRELAKTLRTNIEQYKGESKAMLTKEALSALEFFCNITSDQIIPSKEVQDLHREKINELMNFRLDMILHASFDTNEESFRI